MEQKEEKNVQKKKQKNYFHFLMTVALDYWFLGDSLSKKDNKE